MMILFLVFSGWIMTSFIVFQGYAPGQRIGSLLIRAVMISAYFNAAVACAVLPKQWWPFARRTPGEARPVAFYVGAGLLAALVTQAMALGFDCALGGGTAAGWQRYRLAYPWALTTFAVAFVTSYLADDEVGASWLWPWFEGAIAAAAVMAASYVTALWIDQIHGSPAPATQFRTILAATGMSGFVVGVLVPRWCRRRRAKESNGTGKPLAPAPAGATITLNSPKRTEPKASESNPAAALG